MKIYGDFFPVGGERVSELRERCVVNLECSVQGQPVDVDKICLGVTEADLRASLQSVRPMAVTCANNHFLDYGYEGASRVLNLCRELQIHVVGVKTQNTSQRPFFFSSNGVAYALLNYVHSSASPVYAHGDIRLCEAKFDEVKQDLESLPAGVQGVLVVHCGSEEILWPSPEVIELMSELSSLQPAAIIGHHPHVVQPVAKINSVPVFFSIGNYAFSDIDTVISGKRYIKKNNYRNRRRVAVEVSGHNFGLVDVYARKKVRSDRFFLWVMMWPCYSIIYKVRRFFDLVFHAMFDFVGRPRVPKLKTFISILTGGLK